ncbi:hypothetical protein ABPG72_022553 [Tetrahymena utriculariae]
MSDNPYQLYPHQDPNLQTPQPKQQNRSRMDESICGMNHSDIVKQLQTNQDDETPSKVQTSNVLEDEHIDNGENLITEHLNNVQANYQQAGQISSLNGKNQLGATKNYGFKLPLDQLQKAQQIQIQASQFDTERSLHFEETDFTNQNLLKSSELSNGQPQTPYNNLNGSNFKSSAGKQSQSVSYNPVKRIPIPVTHAKNESALAASSPFVFRTGQSYIGVSHMLASGFSKFQSPRRSPCHNPTSDQVMQANKPNYSTNFSYAQPDEHQSETQKALMTSEINYPLTTRDEISDVKSNYTKMTTSREEHARQKLIESSNQSARLFQTIIRLDSEIKKLRNEPIRGSSKEIAQKLKFGEESSQLKLEESSINGKSKASSITNIADDNGKRLDFEEILLQNKQLKKDVQELRQYKIQASQAHVLQQINKDLVKTREILSAENQSLQEQLMDLQGQLQQIRVDYDQLYDQYDKQQESFKSLRVSTHDHDEFMQMKNTANEASKEIDHYKHLVSQKDQEIESLKKDIKIAQEEKENSSLSESTKQLNHRINEFTNQIRDLQGEKLALIDQIESMQKEVLEVSQENKDLEKRLKETISYLDEKSEKLASMKTQYEANWKELEILRDEQQKLKNKITQYDDRMKVFNLLKSNDEDSILKMNCQLILRKNAFDRYMIHIESVSEITILMATDVTDLIPSKNENPTFQIGFRGHSNKKHVATFEANNRQEMAAVCKALKQFLISAQSSSTKSVSSSSSPNKQIRVEPNKDFLSSIATFF